MIEKADMPGGKWAVKWRVAAVVEDLRAGRVESEDIVLLTGAALEAVKLTAARLTDDVSKMVTTGSVSGKPGGDSEPTVYIPEPPR